MVANEVWWADPKYALEKSVANAVFAHLVKHSGYDGKNDDVYVAVAEHMRLHYPALPLPG